jgi:hypothetical protein
MLSGGDHALLKDDGTDLVLVRGHLNKKGASCP